MKYLASIFLIYSFIKNIYYALFELNQKHNKSGGLFVIFYAFLGITLPLLLLFGVT